MTDANRAKRPALAATVHDRNGHMLGGVRRLAAPLREVFGGFGIQATDQTDDGLVAALEGDLGAAVGRDGAGEDRIGKHRRMAVRLAGTFDPSVVLHADLDHVLRWIETDRAELERHLTTLAADFVVIGRTRRAMDACPRRLRDTEAIVNHIYRLGTGREWDLMFATRAMSPAAAAAIVEHSTENTIANDVEWPMVVERLGMSVSYSEADALSYRITRDFDIDADRHDHDPMQWVTRMRLASTHIETLARFLG